MKSFPRFPAGWISALAFVALTVSAADKSAGTGARFQGPIGLQLYSLRAQFTAKGVPPTLDTVKSFGIKYAELAGTYNLPPEKFKALLEERGIKAISGHFPYKTFKEDPEAIAQDAQA